jgi:hypothetical protein
VTQYQIVIFSNGADDAAVILRNTVNLKLDELGIERGLVRLNVYRAVPSEEKQGRQKANKSGIAEARRKAAKFPSLLIKLFGLLSGAQKAVLVHLLRRSFRRPLLVRFPEGNKVIHLPEPIRYASRKCWRRAKCTMSLDEVVAKIIQSHGTPEAGWRAVRKF